MRLSPNFDLAEFVISQTASRRRIDNTPSQLIISRLKITAAGLELVRSLLGCPVLISSGYRCPPLNEAVGGAKNSAHVEGWATDFISPGFGTPLMVCKAIALSDIMFDQLIEEGTWTHISFDPRARREILTMRNGRYQAGLGTS